jgi:MFS family permease
METLILGWYVLVESGSVVLLTVFGALQFVGTLVSPVLGVLGDRLGLRNVLAGMRVCYAVFASLILFLALTRQISPTLVLMVAAMSGLVRPTDIGMRSALVGATVPPVHLVAAMGIARTTQDSARIAGALAGAGFMAAFGMAPAYGDHRHLRGGCAAHAAVRRPGRGARACRGAAGDRPPLAMARSQGRPGLRLAHAPADRGDEPGSAGEPDRLSAVRRPDALYRP